MKTYTVTWTIQVDADSPREAAEKALGTHRDQESIATCFYVKEIDGEALTSGRPEGEFIDLEEEAPGNAHPDEWEEVSP